LREFDGWMVHAGLMPVRAWFARCSGAALLV